MTMTEKEALNEEQLNSEEIHEELGEIKDKEESNVINKGDDALDAIPEAETVVPNSEAAPDAGEAIDSDTAAANDESTDSDEAADSDDSGRPGRSVSTVDELDYIRQSKPALIESARLLLANKSVQEIIGDIENIRSVFYKKHNLEIADKLKHFLDEGGAEEEFSPGEDPLEDEFKGLYEDFKLRRSEYMKAQEAEKDTNLAKKLEIIEQIKNLVNKQESLNKTFNEFRDLQKAWREIGPVPHTELHSLWVSYHHNVEVFYDYIKINQELRDLDLRKNLDLKIVLCEKAEELMLEPSVVKAFNELQKLHNEWREIGPVPRDKRDELWERFKEATNQINKKHQEFYQNLKDEQKKNLDAKIELCQKIEELLSKEINTPKSWNEYSKEVINLQKVWRTIGFAPRKDNNRIYDRFRKGCDAFFNKKRDYFSVHRDGQHENLQLKTDLCVQAEALMNSTEWKKTTDELIIIQRKWKDIGPVPRKYSDVLWKRFRKACDTFFARRSEHSDNQDSQQLENLKAKQELIEKVKNYTLSENHNEDLGILKKIQKDFTTIGHVPLDKKDEIHQEFRQAIHRLFDQLEVDDDKKEAFRFKQKIDNFAQSPKGNSRLSAEREKLAMKLKQLESDIVLWENNVGFFSKSKSSEKLVKEVQNKIEQAHERIELLKQKLKMIDDSDR